MLAEYGTINLITFSHGPKISLINKIKSNLARDKTQKVLLTLFPFGVKQFELIHRADVLTH